VANTPRGSLLLVDDDQPLRQSMAEFLRSCGLQTETAASCNEALSRMKERQFDVVICDVHLPDHDGKKTRVCERNWINGSGWGTSSAGTTRCRRCST